MRRGTSGINAVIAVDKPLGMTSHDVVNRVRRALGERRVGHAGTLDPDASGVMVVGIGQGTRLMGLMTADDKRYDALVEFGSETNTDDAEGEVTREAPVPDRLAQPEVAQVVVASLVGEVDQVPPAFSAISVNGVRSYQSARDGENFELEPRRVRIFDASLVEVASCRPVTWKCSLHVSKGCYVRSIARDLGRSLGTAAHLCGLRRTVSGLVAIDDCVTLDELAEKGARLVTDRCLDPAHGLGLPVRRLATDELASVACGRTIAAGRLSDGSIPTDGQRVSLVSDGLLLGVWEVTRNRLKCSVNFPSGVAGVRL